MRQHILRLLIVLVLAVGIGLIVYFIVRDNTPFNASSYIVNAVNSNEKLEENFDELHNNTNAYFTEDEIIYSIYKNNLNYYASILVNVEFSKAEASNVKNLFKELESKEKNLITSTNSLITYLSYEDKNENELNGRKEKVNTDFNAFNKSYYNIVIELENLIKEKLYNGLSSNAFFNLKSCLNIITDCYNNNRNNFTFLTNVNNRINALQNNKYNLSEAAVKFSIKYNELDKENLKTDFVSYFAGGVPSDNLNILLTFLNSEVYYE